MEIRLRPELEALIRQDVQRGAYQNVDEYIEHAISMLHEQETWIAENRSQIKTQIDEGYSAAQRGELLEPEEVRSRLDVLRRMRAGEPRRE